MKKAENEIVSPKDNTLVSYDPISEEVIIRTDGRIKVTPNEIALIGKKLKEKNEIKPKKQITKNDLRQLPDIPEEGSQKWAYSGDGRVFLRVTGKGYAIPPTYKKFILFEGPIGLLLALGEVLFEDSWDHIRLLE